MKIYNIDYSKLTTWLVPTFLRKQKTLAFVRVLIEPVIKLYNDLIAFRNDVVYKINHNGQVVYLQKVLNDRFDPSERRIYITDGNINEPTYIYTYLENKPIFLGKRHIYSREELKFRDVDFVVVFPSNFLLKGEVLIRIKALVNYYKLASKTYEIINE